MIRLRLRTLRARLLWGTVFVIVPTMAGVFLLVERHQRAAIVEEMQRRGNVMAGSLAAVSQGPLLLYNFTALEQNVVSVVSELDVRYAIILDADGRVAAHSRRSDRVGAVLEDVVSQRAAASAKPLVQQAAMPRSGEPIYDFAVPIVKGSGDHKKLFNFSVGVFGSQ